MKSLEERIEHLETTTNALIEKDHQNLRDSIEYDAHLTALRTIVEELAFREGVSTQAFVQHYNQRVDYWYEQMMLNYEKRYPGLISRLDPEVGGAANTDVKYGPIFGPLSEGPQG